MEGILAVEKERSEEMRSIMKTIHKPMKKWYKTQDAAFKKKHGRFPLFWQDLDPWSEWTDVYKAYMIATEDKGAGSALRKLTSVSKSAESGDSTASTSKDNASTSVAPSSSTSTTAATNSNAGASPTAMPRKRKSRWGSEKVVKPKSRWGAAAPAPAAPKANLAGMAALGLAPDQLKIMKLRLQLTEVEKKLKNVEQEAKAQAADPNRSPSPDPIMDPETGQRKNTRVALLREKYTKERAAIQKEMNDLGAGMSMSTSSGGMMQRKLYVIACAALPTLRFASVLFQGSRVAVLSLQVHSGERIPGV